MTAPRPRRLKPFPLFVITLVILASTALAAARIEGNITYLEDELLKQTLEQLELEAQISALEKEVDAAKSDSYVIQIARSRYGYLMPGEVRFEVTNIDSVLENPEVEIVEVGK